MILKCFSLFDLLFRKKCSIIQVYFSFWNFKLILHKDFEEPGQS